MCKRGRTDRDTPGAVLPSLPLRRTKPSRHQPIDTPECTFLLSNRSSLNQETRPTTRKPSPFPRRNRPGGNRRRPANSPLPHRRHAAPTRTFQALPRSRRRQPITQPGFPHGPIPSSTPTLPPPQPEKTSAYLAYLALRCPLCTGSRSPWPATTIRRSGPGPPTVPHSPFHPGICTPHRTGPRRMNARRTGRLRTWGATRRNQRSYPAGSNSSRKEAGPGSMAARPKAIAGAPSQYVCNTVTPPTQERSGRSSPHPQRKSFAQLFQKRVPQAQVAA